MASALHVFEYDLAGYRRTWRSSLGVSLFLPLFFLSAMGLGLGGLVNRNSGGVGGVSYLAFLAPGLLAATAMQAAMGEMSFPIMAKVKWIRSYEAMLATPLGVREILLGELLWLAFRLATISVLFMLVMAVFGLLRTPAALLAAPAALLTGLAFGAPMFAFSVTQENDSAYTYLFRFVMMPLFLFSGTFFPLDRLPSPVRELAWLSPLSHGTALTRGVTLGNLGAAEAVAHVAVLAALVLAGALAGRVTLRRRMVR